MKFSTLIEMLEYRAKNSGEKTAFTFQGQPTTFQTLWKQVNQFASVLVEKRITRQECVIIALPNGADFFSAFYGVQLAGGIAVPLLPESSVERIAAITGSCGAKIVVLPDDSQKRSELEEKGFVFWNAKACFCTTSELVDSKAFDLTIFPSCNTPQAARGIPKALC